MLAGEPTPFALFDLSERLNLDRRELEARYHALARAHHPDRFAAQGGQAQAEAAERMEGINRAYRTLKDPRERLRYVLSEHGVPLSQELPAQLAAEYFELQEALHDPSEQAGTLTQLNDLRATLAGLEADWEEEVALLSRAHDARPEAERQGILERLGGLVGNLNTLRAMRRDLDSQLAAAGLAR